MKSLVGNSSGNSEPVSMESQLSSVKSFVETTSAAAAPVTVTTSESSTVATASPVVSRTAVAGSSMMLWRNDQNLSLGYWSVSENGIQRQQVLSNFVPADYSAKIAFDGVFSDGKKTILVFQRNTAHNQVVFPYWILDPTGSGVVKAGYYNFSATMTDGKDRMLIGVQPTESGTAFFYFRERVSGRIGAWSVPLNGETPPTASGVSLLRTGSADAQGLFTSDHRFLGVVRRESRPRLFFHNERTGAIHFANAVGVDNATLIDNAGVYAGLIDPKKYYVLGVYQSELNAPIVLAIRVKSSGDIATWILGDTLAASSGPTLAASVPFIYRCESAGDSSYYGFTESKNGVVPEQIVEVPATPATPAAPAAPGSASCEYGGQTFNHGVGFTAYAKDRIYSQYKDISGQGLLSRNIYCSDQSIALTCNNGTVMMASGGPMPSYVPSINPYSSCVFNGTDGASCEYGGRTFADGRIFDVFQLDRVGPGTRAPLSSTCFAYSWAKPVRCVNGALKEAWDEYGKWDARISEYPYSRCTSTVGGPSSD